MYRTWRMMYRIGQTALSILLVAVPMRLAAEDNHPVDPRLKIAQAATKTVSEAEMRVARSHEQILADIRTAFAEVDKALPQLRGDRTAQSAIAMSKLGSGARHLQRLQPLRRAALHVLRLPRAPQHRPRRSVRRHRPSHPRPSDHLLLREATRPASCTRRRGSQTQRPPPH